MDHLRSGPAAECLFRLVELAIPEDRRQWARAMKAEAAYIGSDAALVSFAAGCLWAAVLEQLRATIERNIGVIATGSAIGIPFSAHAAVNGSGAWPLIWPLIGGAGSALLLARPGSRLEIGSGAWLGLRTGIIAGLLFAVVGVLLIAAFGRAPLDSRLHVIAIGALVGAGLSGAGGSAATLFLRWR